MQSGTQRFVRRSLWPLALLGLCAHAQDAANYPQRNITIVVPYAAGGGTDAMARTIAQALSKKWDKPVIVENRTGAEGLIGTQRVLSAPADGYTMLIQLNSALLYEWVHPGSGVNVMRDFVPVSKIQESPLVLTANAEEKAANLKAMFDKCKKIEKGCSYGTATPNGELVGRQMAEISSLSLTAIPYKGTSPMVVDLLGKNLTFAMLSANQAVPLAKEGKVIALAVGTQTRYKHLPDTPTFEQATGKAVNGTTWYGVFAKAGTPGPILEKWAAALQQISTDPAIQAAIDAQGGIPVFNTQQEFERANEQEYKTVSVLANAFLKKGQ